MKKDLFNYDFLCTNPLNQYSQINPTTGTAINLEYDNNGSLLSNQRLSNEWNEENQLEIIIDQDKGSRSEYLYDGYGRRTQRTDYNSTVGGSASAIIRYLYEGWNCIADYTIEGNSATLSKSYTWGLDLSGSMQGAGGVGGLLSITDHSEGNTHSVSYDGNGNIVDLITQEGEVSAHYEYDLFGNTLVKNGAFAEEKNYRFSTKPINTHAGELYYYGYRYYDPEVGRWLNRDPLAEQAFFETYIGDESKNFTAREFEEFLIQIKQLTNKNEQVFIENAPIVHWDLLGLIIGGGGLTLGQFPYGPGSDFKLSIPCLDGLKSAWQEFLNLKNNGGDDKEAHCEVAKGCGDALSHGVGKGKEIADWLKKKAGQGGAGFDWDDIKANEKGRKCANSKKCKCCCK